MVDMGHRLIDDPRKALPSQIVVQFTEQLLYAFAGIKAYRLSSR